MLFSFGKKCQFMQKTLDFGQMSEFLSIVIKSCCAKKCGKMTRVSLNINFLPKMSILHKKKKSEILGEMLNFPLSFYYYWKLSKTDIFQKQRILLQENLISPLETNIFENSDHFL